MAKAKIDANELIKELREQVNTEWMNDNESISNYLTFVNRFHKYSANNRLLILAQKPDATLCGSFTTWKSLDRKPGFGTGIKIFSPVPVSFPRTDKDGKELLDAEGNKQYIRYMKYACKFSTFDISDTEGADLEKPFTISIENPEAVAGFKESMDDLAASCNLKVEQATVAESKFQEHQVVVRNDLNDLEYALEIATASAFALMHIEAEAFDSIVTDKETANWVARASSFATAARYGLDVREYTAENLVSPPESEQKLTTLLTKAATLSEMIEGKQAGAPNSWLQAWGS